MQRHYQLGIFYVGWQGGTACLATPQDRIEAMPVQQSTNEFSHLASKCGVHTNSQMMAL